MRKAFPVTYRQARHDFLGAVAQRQVPVTSYFMPDHRALDGGLLAMDHVRIGRSDAPDVVVLTSLVHGPELTGSVLQTETLRHVRDLPKNVRIELVHGINPWGADRCYRDNEDNIDPNRHFHRAFTKLPVIAPLFARYPETRDIFTLPDLNPETIRRTSADLNKLVSEREDFIPGIMKGQSDEPHSVHFTGLKPSWSHKAWAKAADQIAAKAKRIVHLDLHTGLGKFGQIQLVPLYRHGPNIDALLNSAWDDKRFATIGPKSVVWPLVGALTGSWSFLLPPAKLAKTEVAGVGVEFGHLNSVILNLNAMRARMALRAQYDDRHPDKAAIIGDMRHAFNPQNVEWQGIVRHEGMRAIKDAVKVLAL